SLFFLMKGRLQRMDNKDDQFDDTLESTEYEHETPIVPPSGKSITCPSCHRSLFSGREGGNFPPYYLYCDRCPIQVTLSPWLEVKNAKWTQIHEIRERDHIYEYEAFMRIVEAALKPCVCGGSYLYDAPRRCFTCNAPVIFESDVELYPDDGFIRWRFS